MAGKMCMMMMVMIMVIMKCDLKACNEIDYMEKDVLCLENCIIKCGEDNYQCQTLCYDDCDPSLIGYTLLIYVNRFFSILSRYYMILT